MRPRLDGIFQAFALLVIVLIGALALGTMPGRMACMAKDGNWWKPTGRMHCDLEAWRALWPREK